MKQYLQILFACNLLVLLSSCGPRWSETDKGDYNIVDNKGGKTLGYSSHSGVTLLEKNGYAFKDLNKKTLNVRWGICIRLPQPVQNSLE